MCLLSRFSCAQLFVTPWTAALQTPLFMGFSRQEYWSGLPWPPLGDLPDPGIETMSLTSPILAGGPFFSATWEAQFGRVRRQSLTYLQYLKAVVLPVCSQDQHHPGMNSVQFSSVTQSLLTLCDPMNRSTPGLPVHHQLPEFTQTHVRGVSDAIQPSHPLSSPSPPAPNPSQHQSLFQ